MNSHPLGKPVLSITGNGVRSILVYSNKHFELKEYINELKNSYLSSSLNSGNGDVDFDDPTYQACYVFLYFPVLCYGTFYGLLECYHQGNFEILKRNALKSGSLRVCALGGGPGTDIFGVRMFLNSIECKYVWLQATVLEKHTRWRTAFQCLSSQLNTCNISADYLHLEVGGRHRNDIYPHHQNALANADLITCSKFISAVRVLPNSRITILKLLKEVKPGAYLFYLENSKGGNTEFFRSVAQAAGFTEVICFERGEDDPFKLPNMEKSSYLGDIPRWFNFSSQRNLRVTFMLWRKNGQHVSSPSSNHVPLWSNYATDSDFGIVASPSSNHGRLWPHYGFDGDDPEYRLNQSNRRSVYMSIAARRELEAQRNADRSCPCVVL